MAEQGEEESYEQEFNFAVNIVRLAGEIIRQAFFKDKSITEKTCHNDLVTDTDKLVETVITERIRENYPTSKIIGEEGASEAGGCELTLERTWIIDPIDGTTNFIHRNQHICTILALAVQKEIVFGIVFNPVTEELWTARKGKGAFYNGRKIEVSDCTDLKSCLVVQEFYGASEEKNEMMLENLRTLTPRVRSVRSYGSAGLDLAYLAMGAVDLYFDSGLHIWDYAGPSLIVREAGGVIKDIYGGQLDLLARRMIAAASNTLAGEAIPLLKVVDMGRD